MCLHTEFRDNGIEAITQFHVFLRSLRITVFEDRRTRLDLQIGGTRALFYKIYYLAKTKRRDDFKKSYEIHIIGFVVNQCQMCKNNLVLIHFNEVPTFNFGRKVSIQNCHQILGVLLPILYTFYCYRSEFS